jgi:putative membrane-bound dehydrogenase-like protein
MNAAILSLVLLAPAADPAPAAGVLPVGADGRPLNLDFETGTLKDWTADGEAFRDQPVKGDTVAPRRGDMRSRHQGRYWVGGYEKYGDKPTGTLTSVPFKVTHPWASFLVGGGPHPAETCVELVLTPGEEVIFRASGTEKEDLERVAVDLTRYKGFNLRIRLVDKHTGHWGHVNFDDFRFHNEKPAGVRPPPAPTALDVYPYAGLPPEKAAAAMTVPPGFEVKLFAGEPDVHQPVAMCTDDRGRLWVVEAYTYPRRHPHPGPVLPDAEKAKGDRIVIFEDADGDGKHDKRTVFMEGLNLVSGIELGFGGVWVGAAPYLLFVPDKDGDDKPDAGPQVLLDGWGYQDTHETLNSFIWGPDGWLYGCHGVFTHSRVGKPGTPDDKRIPINAGIWRYHPTRHVFEVFAHGTSNPWGLDYNAHGEFFIEACVIPHMWHIVQGGRYNRQAGTHFDPHTYIEIPTIALHRHYAGPNPHGGNNRSDAAGGGHAHSGLLCYQGGLWPKEYHGKLFMGNLHGHRLNVDALALTAFGYVADRNPDFLKTNDRWSIPVALQASHDGNAYLCDWYDKQICHRPEPEVWDRTNGRVYKVVYKGTRPAPVDLKKATDDELVQYQLSDNDWYARHARRILQERHAAKTLFDPAATRGQLADIAFRHKDDTRRLRALWALHVTGGLTDDMYAKALAHRPDPAAGPDYAGAVVPAWAIRLGTETGRVPPPVRKALAEDADRSPSPWPLYRLARLSALLRLPPADRWDGLAGLIASDYGPTMTPLLWYAAEPLAVADLPRLLTLRVFRNSPELTRLAVRRAVDADPAKAAAAVVGLMDGEKSHFSGSLNLPIALNEALRACGRVPAPAGWPAAREYVLKAAGPGDGAKDIRSELLLLGLRFGDEAALAEVREAVLDAGNPLGRRRAALDSLQDIKDPNLPTLLRKLLTDDDLRGAAIRGLGTNDDPATVAALLAVYPKLGPDDKRAVVGTLASRAAFASALLDAVETKAIPAADIPAETVRQLRNLGVKQIDDKIAAVWGIVRDTPADRKRLIGEWKAKLTRPYSGPVDLGLGRAVYARTCQQCHTLYAVGGKVGPDITGSNRADLDYLLENILDPSAVIPKEYAATRLSLADGRVLTGIVKDGPGAAVTVVTATETVVVPKADIEDQKPSDLSMMPDDILKTTTEPELRALIAYLRHPQQVPMLATPENAKDFFNGKDLTGWDGDKEVWSVQDGAIVGKTEKGLKHNNFLTSAVAVEDFKLSLKVKLTPNTENSGIQFRSERIEGGEMRGPQADIGKGWWGKLYEESARGLLVKEGGEQHVKPNDWNDYVIEAKGPNVKIWINGRKVCDYTDEKLARRGVIGFQVHSGGPTDVRFKDIKLEVLGK